MADLESSGLSRHALEQRPRISTPYAVANERFGPVLRPVIGGKEKEFPSGTPYKP